jgi:hypothetical protein
MVMTVLSALLALTALSLPATDAEKADAAKQDLVLYHHPGRYSAFPSLFGRGNEMWVSFGWNTSRSHFGKAAGGQTGSVQLYSPDGGRRWLERGRDTDYRPVPAERAWFVLPDGTRLQIAPLMHEVLPGEKRAELEARGIQVRQWPGGHISASYRVRMTRQLPGATKPETSYPTLPPVASIAGFGAGVALADGTVIKPVYGLRSLADPATRAWVLRSTDGGAHWQLIDIAYDGVHSFNEADVLDLGRGRLLAMVRVEGGKGRAPAWERGFLWQTESADGGRTWTTPHRTDMWGYPPTLLRLGDGRILCSYGYRRPPYGIRACFSRDEGRTWDVAHEAILRDDALPEGPASGHGSTSDLGYPRTVQLPDGKLFTVYYFTLGDGVTHIAATRWSPDYRGPADVPRGRAAVRESQPDPRLAPERILGEVGPVKFDYGLMQSFIPTAPQIGMVAVRVSRQSGRPDLKHTYGLYVAIRKPQGDQWWTAALANSRVLKPDQVKIGAWNAFVFDKPVAVTPGELYVLTVYNRDYLGGPTRMRPELSGDHTWYLNSSVGQPGDYPNGSRSPDELDDLAFKVYAQPGPLPQN